MQILGRASQVEKSVLTDSLGREHSYLRISLTDRCNLRCTYCMPQDGYPVLPSSEIMSYEEILQLAYYFTSWGVNKIRLTGGEPLVRKDVVNLVERLSLMVPEVELGLTTNGVFLAPLAKKLKEAGLHKLNISLDSLLPKRFAQITRRDEWQKVWDGILVALEQDFSEIKINVVLIRGVNDDEILDFVELTRHMNLQVRFIEYMPFAQNEWEQNKIMSYQEILELISQKYEFEPLNQNSAHIVAQTFQIEGFKGSFGVIASMTETFCSDCNRIRLQADGGFKNCLFSPAQNNLKDALRAGASEEDLAILVQESLWNKKIEHSDSAFLADEVGASMVGIGG